MEQQPFESNYPRDFSAAGGGSNRFRGMSPGVYIDWIGTAWSYIRSNMGMYAVASLVLIAVAGAAGIPYQIATFLGGFSGSSLSDSGTRNSILPVFLALPLMLVTYVFSIVVSYAMSAGFILFCLDHVDGKELNISRMFDPFKQAGQVSIASFMVGLATGVGALACLVGAFYVAGRTLFTVVLVVDQKMAWKEALTLCWERCKPFAWMLFLMMFISSICAALGFLACCVGILVTYPILGLMTAMHYRVLFQEFGDNNPVAPSSAIG